MKALRATVLGTVLLLSACEIEPTPVDYIDRATSAEARLGFLSTGLAVFALRIAVVGLLVWGAFRLVMAFFGSKFVLEILLDRSSV